MFTIAAVRVVGGIPATLLLSRLGPSLLLLPLTAVPTSIRCRGEITSARTGAWPGGRPLAEL